MSNEKVAVVTGSNKGIGLEVVRHLCEKGVYKHVYLTSRNKELGMEAVKNLNSDGFNPLYHQLDITDQESVDKFASHLKETHGQLDCLVNNAGIAYKVASTAPFAEQAEKTVLTNFHATLRACHALFPLLSPNARVVNVSSSCGHLLKINGTEPAAGELRKKFASEELTENDLVEMMEEFVRLAKDNHHVAAGWPNSSYNVSKVGVSALTRLQQRFVGSNILVNHVHPGWVDTDMTSHKGPLTVKEGATPIVWAACLPEDSTVRGQYVWKDCTIIDWVKTPLPQPV